MNRISLRMLGVSMALGAAGSVGIPATQTAYAASDSRADGDRAQELGQRLASGVLETITVTALKREQRLQDVPMSITALSGESLADSGIFNSQDLAMTVPGLNIGNVGVLGTVSIRGVNTALQGIVSDPSAAIYVDGVYQPRFEASLFELMDINRVEVLKGPQVVLYGRNATAGSILFYSNEPGREFGGDVSVQLGNYNLVRVNAQADIPLVHDKLLLRVAAAGAENDGYTTNAFIPSDHPARTDARSGRFTLKYLPAEGVDFILRGYRVDQRGSMNALKALTPAALGSAYDIRDVRTVSSEQISSMPSRSDGLNLTVNWDFDWAKLTSISAYSHNSFGPLNFDTDTTELTIINVGVHGEPSLGLRQESRLRSQEVYLAGTAGRFDWLAGAVYTRETGRYGGADELNFGSPFLLFFPATNITEAYAAYAQLGYDVTDKLKLSAGVRYNDESKEVGRALPSPSPAPLQQSKGSWDAWIPSFTASYSVTQDDMLYATVSKGFKSGGFNQFDLGPALNPERITSYEVGAKNVWLDGILRSELGVFHYDYTNLQLGITDQTQLLRYENAGEAEGEGVEAALHALVGDNFQIDLGLAALRTEYKKFDTFVAGVPVSYSGNDLVQTPELTMNVGAAYALPISWGTATLRADYYYSDRLYFSNDNDPELSQAPYSLVNARITFAPPAGRWEFHAYGKNLGDKVVYSHALKLGTVPVVVLNAPRTYGVELQYSF